VTHVPDEAPARRLLGLLLLLCFFSSASRARFSRSIIFRASFTFALNSSSALLAAVFPRRVRTWDWRSGFS
jgi:hypothetical protein